MISSRGLIGEPIHPQNNKKYKKNIPPDKKTKLKKVTSEIVSAYVEKVRVSCMLNISLSEMINILIC